MKKREISDGSVACFVGDWLKNVPGKFAESSKKILQRRVGGISEIIIGRGLSLHCSKILWIIFSDFPPLISSTSNSIKSNTLKIMVTKYIIILSDIACEFYIYMNKT